jgi:hypothetical protein
VNSINSNYEIAQKLPFQKAFHLIRDPRDIIVSGYYSHLETHPISQWKELAIHRTRRQGLSKDEGLLAEMEFCAEFLNDIASWNYDDERILEVKFEQLVRSPEVSWNKILKHLGLCDEEIMDSKKEYFVSLINRIAYKIGLFRYWKIPQLPVSSALCMEAVNMFSFERLSKGRRPGEEDLTSHYRKGVVNEWQSHFTEQHKSRFKELFGDILVLTNYEKENEW